MLQGCPEVVDDGARLANARRPLLLGTGVDRGAGRTHDLVEHARDVHVRSVAHEREVLDEGAHEDARALGVGRDHVVDAEDEWLPDAREDDGAAGRGLGEGDSRDLGEEDAGEGVRHGVGVEPGREGRAEGHVA